MGWENRSLSNSPGHMTKMATMPIYGKNLKKSTPKRKGPKFVQRNWIDLDLLCFWKDKKSGFFRTYALN